VRGRRARGVEEQKRKRREAGAGFSDDALRQAVLRCAVAARKLEQAMWPSRAAPLPESMAAAAGLERCVGLLLLGCSILPTVPYRALEAVASLDIALRLLPRIQRAQSMTALVAGPTSPAIKACWLAARTRSLLPC